MSEYDLIFDRFASELDTFLVKIQSGGVLDVDAFDRLERDSRKLAEELKTRPFLPRSVLWRLRKTTKILEAEAPYIAGKESEMYDMRAKLEMTFDLILLGEDHNDRMSEDAV